MTRVAAMVALSTVPRTRTLAPFFTARAEARWVPLVYFVEDASVTVTSTPVAVAKVKPDEDVVSTMPVAPPAAGPDTGPPPVGRLGLAVGEDVAVSERDDADDEKSAAADGPAPVSPATAHVSPAATIHPPFFFDSNRRTLGRRACTATVAGADPAGEWLVAS
ncbi:hypothetical protein ABZY10_06295 [Streptomyces sp. NPDC006539]|uniref:hypothetical protein n=1 Tax=unclassified Streptomyces TaxID=2593676 RepID=UPI0033B66246